MTEELFREDAYLLSCQATVQAVDELGVVLDRTVFYPLGGGQAGDIGTSPRGLGRVRVLEIVDVDLQPCSGTHVANTAETGASARVNSCWPSRAMKAMSLMSSPSAAMVGIERHVLHRHRP